MKPHTSQHALSVTGLIGCLVVLLAVGPVLALQLTVQEQGEAAACTEACCQVPANCCGGHDQSESEKPQHPCSDGENPNCPCHRVTVGQVSFFAIALESIDLPGPDTSDLIARGDDTLSSAIAEWSIDHPPRV